MVTEAQKKASHKYKQAKYSRIPFDVPKEYHLYLKETAGSLGMSVNGFIRKAVDEKCERLDGDPLPESLLCNLTEWLKAHGHNNDEILDCISSLEKEDA